MKKHKNNFNKVWLSPIAAAPSFLALFFTAFLLPLFSACATDYVPLAPIPGTVSASGSTDLPTYLTGIFKVGIAAAGVLAFLTIVWGGFTYLSTDAITGKEEGKARIGRALGGLILALAAYIILNTINPNLVNLNLMLSPANPGANLTPPPDLTYEEQLDQTAAKINQNLAATKAQATAIETTAKTEQTTADDLYYSGTITKAEYDAAQSKIDALKTQAQAIRDYNTTLDALDLHKLNGGAARFSDQSQSQAEEILTTIGSNESTTAQKLANAETADPSNASRYATWIGDIEKKADAARLATAQAQIDAGDVGVAKHVIDKAYSDAKTAVDNANNDQTVISAIIARRDALVTAVQKACGQHDSLSSCSDYTPSH